MAAIQDGKECQLEIEKGDEVISLSMSSQHSKAVTYQMKVRLSVVMLVRHLGTQLVAMLVLMWPVYCTPR